MVHYEFKDFQKDIITLSKDIKDNFDPDAVVGIARGGLTMAHFISIALKLRSCFSLNSIHYDDTKKLDTIKLFNIPDLSGYKKVLLVDDIVDSGDTMHAIKENLSAKFPDIDIRVATMFYKDSAKFMPEFKIHKANDWIVFFWDIEI